MSAPRDEELPPPQPIVGRLARAQANFYETFPLYAAAALIVAVAHLTDRWTAIGAWLWLGARIVYLPLYAPRRAVMSGPLAWLVSVVGIVMVLRPALAAIF